MNKLLVLSMMIIVTLLSGCNGPSGKNGIVDASSQTAASVTITMADSQGVSGVSFDKNLTLTLTATVVDQTGQALASQKVDFSTTLGELLPTSKLTDANGQAIIQLSNQTLAIGAGTVSASSGSVSGSVDFEFVDFGSTQQSAILSSKLLLDNLAVNQFKTNQTVRLTSLLTDSHHQPIAGAIIHFTADIGSLSVDSALTDSNGVAQVSLTGAGIIGAGVLTASYTDTSNHVSASRMNYQILAQDAVIVNNDINIGYFDASNVFVAGKIKLSVANNQLSAGGTLGVSVDLVDSTGQRVITPTPVTFTSNCVASGHARIDDTVFTVNGSAKATFEDIDCAGITGTNDVIIASINVNNTSKSASDTIAISGEQLGAIEFVSAAPTAIVLKGTGGQGRQEYSTITFLVKSSLGNPVAQQKVDFALNTAVGGITLNPASGLTNSQGLVSTQVIAGTVPTAIRVSAQAALTTNNQTVTVQTQSDLLSISTGLPEQRSMSLSATVLNPEADSFTGETSQITAWLADNFNNPVPDGTTVNFTTEGGVIEPSCVTQNGRCSVTWTAQEPRVSDHRITILATAIGHESFFDTNGNNIFDDQDGGASADLAVSSGFEQIKPQTSGFIDMTEAWRDDNENRQHDAGEPFLDFDNSNSFTVEDGLFNGPQCQGALCAAQNARSIHVRKALVLVMSGSTADLQLTNSDTGILLADTAGNGTGIPDIIDGKSLSLTLSFSDLANQPLPANSTITVTLSAGDLAGTTTYQMPKTNAKGKTSIHFVISNVLGGDPAVGTLTMTIVTPKGITTSLVKTVNLK